MSEKIPLVECFGPTVQGEGALAGQISYFLRFGGCDWDCSWCDSRHAVDPSQIKKYSKYLTREEIVEEARRLTKHAPLFQWITLSGGNPAIWDLTEVVSALKLDEMKVAVETQGSIIPSWFSYCDLITCSPKPPSSGMADRFNPETLHQLVELHQKRVVLKVVIFNNKDIDFAEKLKETFPRIPFYLSVGTAVQSKNDQLSDYALSNKVLKSYKWLAREFLKRPTLYGATISPQMHVLLYGHAKGV